MLNLSSRHSREETVQKIVDTINIKLDSDVSMEDLDWAATALLRVRELQEGDIIYKKDNSN